MGSTRNWRPIGSARDPAPTSKPRWAARSVSCRSSRRAPSWLDVVWNWTRKRFGESRANWGPRCWRPAPATCYGSGRRIARRERVRGQEDRGRDRWRPGPGAHRHREGRVSGKMKRKKFRIEWREPKVVILFETDEKGRMVKGSRPVIDGTLQGPDALIELVAFHLHRLGAAQAKLVTFVADGAPWIWARLDWVIAQVKLDPARVVEVLDWCHGVHHLSLALAALDLAEERRAEQYSRLARLLKAGKSQDVIEELEELAAGQPEDSPVWREIRYLRKHSEAGRLRYNCFRCRGVPLGSGAIESTIRRVINLRLKGNEHLLDGGQCGSGVPTAGRRRFGAVGRDRGTHARSDGEGPPNGLALDTTGVPGGVESARRRGRRLDATINEETI